VVACQVRVGEGDGGVLLKALGEPFAVLAEQRLDDHGHLSGCGGGDGQPSIDNVGGDAPSLSLHAREYSSPE
jgi:hypothetical protein